MVRPVEGDAASASAPGGPVTLADLASVASERGLHHLGVTSTEPFEEARRALDHRKAAGLDGGMQFTYRNPARSTEPRRILDGARSIVVGAWAYDDRECSDAGVGRVARYARHDHYADLGAALGSVASHLEAAGHRARVVMDDNALVDRAAAVRAGIGWFGKNANVLIPGAGSWFVLGSVVTTADIAPSTSLVADGCGPCTACRRGCPTGAIVSDGVIDGRRCIAWLVQAPGPIPVEFRSAMGHRIYGCDDCQEVCPINRHDDPKATASAVPAAQPVLDRLDLVELLTMPDEDLLQRYGRWYIAERDPRVLRRNALVAAGNSSPDPALRAAVAHLSESGDALLAEHADWAIAQWAERSTSETAGAVE